MELRWDRDTGTVLLVLSDSGNFRQMAAQSPLERAFLFFPILGGVGAVRKG